MATPPDTFPTWGTDGGAEITDPGASKRATGFLTAEAPAAGHMNHQLNRIGGWLTYLRDQVGARIAFASIDRKGTTPWNTTSTNLFINYLPGIDRWYCAIEGTDGDVWDSADGETWSATKQLDATTTTLTQFVELAGDVHVGVDVQIYKTTTGLVTNMASVSATFANITALTGLLWDETNSLWLACGTAGANGHIEAVAAPGWAFTNMETFTSNFRNIAINQTTGKSVAITSTDTVYTSSNGTTWTANTTPAIAFNGLHFNVALGLFAAIDANNQLHLSVDGTGAWAIPSAFPDVHNVIDSPEGLVVFNAYNAAADPGGVFVLRNAEDKDNYDVEYLGRIEASSDANIISKSWDDGDSISSGNHQWVFPYSTTHQLALANY